MARLVLYGSRARGEARPDSDIDLLIVVNGEVNYAELLGCTSEIVASLSLEHDVVISRAFASESQFTGSKSPFLLGIRREGVPV